MSGSSPRVWGTERGPRAKRAPCRFIPTRVGNSIRGRPVHARSPVHPHACGEQQAAVVRPARGLGSSPRVWGTVAVGVEVEPVERFIPTRVGNSALSGSEARRIPVHPHACGEQATGRPRRAVHRRFIPTRVGNRSAVRRARRPPAVHPHACGEQRIGRARRSYRTGSSPRVWGTEPRLPRAPGYGRFIPTRVGNSSTGRRGRARTSVHPHACGEQQLMKQAAFAQFGSSPRVWGTVDLRQLGEKPFRFIPTRVGNRTPQSGRCAY